MNRLAGWLVALTLPWIALEGTAHACVPYPRPSGKLVSFALERLARADSDSAVVCQAPQGPGVGSCPAPTYRSKLRAGLLVRLSYEEGTESTNGVGPGDWVDDQSEFLLKDAGGVVIAQGSYQPLEPSPWFVQLGAEVCVTVRDHDDDGQPVGAPREVCEPVTVSSLEVTADEQHAHTESVQEACAALAQNSSSGGGGSSGGSSGGDTTGGDIAGDDGLPVSGAKTSGGCAAAPGAGIGSALLLGALCAWGVRRRRRH